MSKEQHEKTEALFDTLSRNKKRRRRRIAITVTAVILAAAVILVAAVGRMQRKVWEDFGRTNADVLSWEVSRGTITTTVTGSGVLVRDCLEALTLPAGVEVEEILVEADAQVKTGDILATVEMASVLSALSDLQGELEELDAQIADAKGDAVSSTVKAGVDGRVKVIHAEKGEDVAGCMARNGALAVLSLDGYMAVDIEASPEKGSPVTVVCGETEYEGTVDTVLQGTATILVTDNGPSFDEEVTVKTADGTILGTGRLYIHSPLAVTGFAGTVSTVSARENTRVSASTTLFHLKDTGYSANYDSLLRQRSEKEAVLLELLTIYRDGAVLSPMDGVVSSVEFGAEQTQEVSALAGYTTAAAAETEETALLTLYPDEKMTVTIGIDETDILALEVGQEAEITVSSVSEEVFSGTVTEISKQASTATGVTQYSAVVTLDKVKGMLPGMTAEVDVKIEGVDNAIIIPLDALHQTSAISFVYTSYDEETQQYGGIVEVTTGMQGSKYVEITAGLSEGQTVYYTEAQTNPFLEMMGMGGMGNMNGMGGQRPGGFGGGQGGRP